LQNKKPDINPEEHPNPENNPSANKPKKRRVRRGYYWFAGIFTIFFVIIPLLANYYADRIFGETASEIIRQETDGKYIFDYDDISFNLFNRDLVIHNLAILPNPALTDSITGKYQHPDKYMELRTQQFHLKGAGLISVFLYRELTIKNLYLEKPELKIVIPEITNKTANIDDPVSRTKFDLRNLHTYIKDYLSLLKVIKFQMNEGVLEIHQMANDTTEVIRVNNISVQVSGFHLDPVSHLNPDKLFFSDSIGVSLKGGNINLKKKNVEIAFNEINISTTGQSIELLDVFIGPETQGLTSSQTLSLLNIPKILISGIDFARLPESELLLNEILLSRPHIKWEPATGAAHKKSPDEIARGVFNELSAVFHPVVVNKILIEHASLEIDKLQTEQLDALKLPDLSLTLYNLQIDSSFLSSPKPFYFIEDFSLNLTNQALELNKPEENLSFDNLNLDTRTSTLIVDNLKITAQNEESHRLSVNMQLPQLKITGRDFKKDYVEKSLKLSLLEFDNPKINLGFEPKIKMAGDPVKLNNLYDYIDEFIEVLAIDKIKVNDARFTFDNDDQLFEEQVKVLNFNIEISDFVLNGDTANMADKVLFSSDIDIDIEGLIVELPDSIHQMNLDRLVIDTKSSFLKLEGAHIDTLKNIAANRYLQKDRAKIDINNITVTDFDFENLYHNKIIDIGILSVDGPKAHIFNTEQKLPDTANKFPGFLNNYRIGNLEVKGLDLVKDGPGLDNRAIEITGAGFNAFGVKPGILANSGKVYTDSLQLNIEQVLFDLPDSIHVLQTGNIFLSNIDSLLRIKDIRIYPGNQALSVEDNIMTINIPELYISGFDVGSAIYNKQLMAQSLTMDQPEVQLIVSGERRKASFRNWDSEHLKGQLLKILNKWDLNETVFKNSAIKIYSGKTFNTKIFAADDFTITVNGLYVDPTVSMTKDNVLFAHDIKLDLNKPMEAAGDKNQWFTLDGLSLSTLEGRVRIEQFELSDVKAHKKWKHIDNKEARFGFADVDISGLDFSQLINDKNLVIDSVLVGSPVFLMKREFSKQPTKSVSGHKINIYNLISNHLFAVRINDLNIDDAVIKISDKQTNKPTTFLVNRVDADFRHINIDSSNKVFGDKFLYSDDLDLNIKGYSYKTGNGLYLMGASNIHFSSNDGLLIVDSGYMKPLLGPKAFANKLGVQTDRLDWVFRQARLENFRLYNLFFDNYFWADNFILSGLVGEDYRDKSFPRPKNHYPKLPVKALKDLEFGVRLDSVNIVGSSFKYLQYVEPATRAGEIWFDDINIEGRNITNDIDLLSSNSEMIFDIKTKLMGNGSLIMNIKFDLKSENSFRVESYINQMDLTEMNPLLEHIAFVKIKKGQNVLTHLFFEADNDVARGEMTFKYKNLSVRLIDKKTLKDKGFGGSVASFVANTFVVRSDNPKWGLFEREGKIYFKRDKEKSFFNYLAKSTLSGVNATIRGGNEERKEMRIKRREDGRK